MGFVRQGISLTILSGNGLSAWDTPLLSFIFPFFIYSFLSATWKPDLLCTHSIHPQHAYTPPSLVLDLPANYLLRRMCTTGTTTMHVACTHRPLKFSFHCIPLAPLFPHAWISTVGSLILPMETSWSSYKSSCGVPKCLYYRISLSLNFMMVFHSSNFNPPTTNALHLLQFPSFLVVVVGVATGKFTFSLSFQTAVYRSPSLGQWANIQLGWANLLVHFPTPFFVFWFLPHSH